MDLDPSWNFLFQHWKEIVGFTWTHQSSLFSSHFKTMSQWYRNSIKSNWNIYCAIVVSTYSSQKKNETSSTFPTKLPSSIFHQTPSAPFQMFVRWRDGRDVRGVTRQVPGDRPSNIGEIQIQIEETRLDGRWEKNSQNLPYQGGPRIQL